MSRGEGGAGGGILAEERVVQEVGHEQKKWDCRTRPEEGMGLQQRIFADKHKIIYVPYSLFLFRV